MDASLLAARLSEDLAALLGEGDFEGAEELLSSALASSPEAGAFIHYQLGRVYLKWNKLSSAIHHLNAAVDAAISVGDRFFLIQILDELNLAKKFQRGQQP